MRVRSINRSLMWMLAGVLAGSAAAHAQSPARLRATIDAVNGNSMALTTRAGDKVTWQLHPVLSSPSFPR